MIKLYSDEEFKLAKSSDKLQLKCEQCDKIIIKEKRVINYGINGYEGRQNDLCKECFYERKIIILTETCNNCSRLFEYKKSDKKKSGVKLCSKECRQDHLQKCNKLQREEINKKVSLKLKEKLKEKSLKKCKKCGYEFHGRNKYCGKECIKKYFASEEHRNMMSKSLKGKAGGLRDGGGHSKMYEYINIHGDKMKLNNDEIEIAKVLDNLNLNWNRNKTGFRYDNLSGESRNYYPDFYIKDYDIYLEYKGFVTDEMNHKMKDATIKNNFDLLIIYSNSKRYRHLGLNSEQVSIDNNTIIENILKIKRAHMITGSQADSYSASSGS